MVRTQSEKAVLRRNKIDRTQGDFVPQGATRVSNSNVFSLKQQERHIVAPLGFARVSIPFAREPEPAHPSTPPPLACGKGRGVVPTHGRQGLDQERPM